MGRSRVINNFQKKCGSKKKDFLTIKDVLRYGSFKLLLLRHTQIIFGCVCNYLSLLLFPARLNEFVRLFATQGNLIAVKGRGNKKNMKLRLVVFVTAGCLKKK